MATPQPAETQTAEQAPAWQRQPYRLLFPLGALLGWVGVSHGLLFALGLSTEWRTPFHGIAQIQGFMICFAAGFLFTMIPRRTDTAGPAGWQMAVAMIAPAGTTYCGWMNWLALSQMFWMVLVITLLVFCLRRFRSSDSGRRPPTSFVWIPAALFMGIAGSVLLSLFGALGLDWKVHQLGNGVLLQGMFLCLVLGVGSLALPVIAGSGKGPADATDGASRGLLLHGLGIALLLASFACEVLVHRRLGVGMRGLQVLATLLVVARIWQRPAKPGRHRWLVWMAAWAVPLGYLFAALMPNRHHAAALHVVFVGGFGLMALAVGLHVSLAHGGRDDLVGGKPWQVPALAVSLLLALVSRSLVSFDTANRRLWLGAAATLFLLATVFWGWLLWRGRSRS